MRMNKVFAHTLYAWFVGVNGWISIIKFYDNSLVASGFGCGRILFGSQFSEVNIIVSPRSRYCIISCDLFNICVADSFVNKFISFLDQPERDLYRSFYEFVRLSDSIHFHRLLLLFPISKVSAPRVIAHNTDCWARQWMQTLMWIAGPGMVYLDAITPSQHITKPWMNNKYKVRKWMEIRITNFNVKYFIINDDWRLGGGFHITLFSSVSFSPQKNDKVSMYVFALSDCRHRRARSFYPSIRSGVRTSPCVANFYQRIFVTHFSISCLNK